MNEFSNAMPSCVRSIPFSNSTGSTRSLADPSGARAASVSHPDFDRLLTGSPLRRSGVCRVICAVLLAVLVFATFVHLSLLASMRADVASVFYRALALSSVLAAVPLAVLWFLDRRERGTPWLFAAAFLRGGFIATALALPFNSAFFVLVDAWVRQHPTLLEVLGPDAAML
jgi:protease PrsW